MAGGDEGLARARSVRVRELVAGGHVALGVHREDEERGVHAALGGGRPIATTMSIRCAARALDRVELEPAVEEVRPGRLLVRPRLFSDGQYVERLRGTARPEGEYSVERAAESFEPPARARRHADAYWARHADTRVWAAAFERASTETARRMHDAAVKGEDE